MSHFATLGDPPSPAEAELALALAFDRHGVEPPDSFQPLGLMLVGIDRSLIIAALAAIFVLMANRK
ncbi:MAG TPA: hypothetical protein VL551_03985 [Actinospica sp.]|jgi:hypothetical protein|nr:hypothetical protein [Actinospica sp.]